jgi:hypothetical protein
MKYEVVERKKKRASGSRQAQKAWKKGTLIWNSEERGTYYKEEKIEFSKKGFKL